MTAVAEDILTRTRLSECAPGDLVIPSDTNEVFLLIGTWNDGKNIACCLRARTYRAHWCSHADTGPFDRFEP